MRILVTGARGFIGSAFIRAACRSRKDKIVGWARLTQAWTSPRLEHNPNLQQALKSGQLKIVYGDLSHDISGLCEGIDIVVHFAAKTYVDHSIRDPAPFIVANTLGTTLLLEEARRQGVKGFIHVSTDEVYGQILEGSYSEEAPLNPRNPYAASKSGADAITISYYHTYKMWTAVTRTENNYGPYQHPQKAIPVFVKHALNNDQIPIYGDGLHVRQWLQVDEHVAALWSLIDNMQKLPGGEIWHIAGREEVTNKELAIRILRILEIPESKVRYVDDRNIRPGHDRRYSLNCEKIQKATGWHSSISLEQGLEDCVKWYVENPAWLK